MIYEFKQSNMDEILDGARIANEVSRGTKIALKILYAD